LQIQLTSDANAFKEAFELGQASNAKVGGGDDDEAASESESAAEPEVVNVSITRMTCVHANDQDTNETEAAKDESSTA
jgi:hypothetical protein